MSEQSPSNNNPGGNGSAPESKQGGQDSHLPKATPGGQPSFEIRIKPGGKGFDIRSLLSSLGGGKGASGDIPIADLTYTSSSGRLYPAENPAATKLGEYSRYMGEASSYLNRLAEQGYWTREQAEVYAQGYANCMHAADVLHRNALPKNIAEDTPLSHTWAYPPETTPNPYKGIESMAVVNQKLYEDLCRYKDGKDPAPVPMLSVIK